jgi:pimeloyl-ACP methyl ester carboxylesterase
MEMFNDLRGTPEIRQHYQFWFYLYPTGLPYLITSADLRRDLADVRRKLDPDLQSPALDQMVLVGHSMGGLLARLQTLDSRRDYWQLISDQPLSEIDAPEEIVTTLRNALFFGANPSVRRVVTIATPHRGSNFSNGATQWLGRRLIDLPETLLRVPEYLANQGASRVSLSDMSPQQTSIDALSPSSPFLQVMQLSPSPSWVKYHNIVGLIAEEGVLSKVAGRSDGVVTVASAHLEEAESEQIVEADHVNIHRHPRTVMEVQRILLEHLDEVTRHAMQRLPAPSISRLPVP